MRFRSLSLAAAAAATLAACSATAPTRYHTLMPAEPPARAPAARTLAVAAVLEPIRLPAQVDKPQWLVRLPDDSVVVLEQERWASPLRDELRQSLREELIAGWGMMEQRPLVGERPPVRIGIDFRRFDSVIGGEVRVAGSWSLTAGNASSTATHCEWFIRERAGGEMPSLAAAHRRAGVRLAAAVGAGLGRVSRGESANCPAPDSGA